MPGRCLRALAAGWLAFVAAVVAPPSAADEALIEAIARIKPSIVGVGTYSTVRRPPAQLHGTGFIVGNGRHAATNFHVVDVELDARTRESIVVFIGSGRDVEYRTARIVAQDRDHDLALLAFEGPALPALELSREREVREGTTVAFTGFPIGAVLGLQPVTHQGIVSAITPIVIPANHARQLTVDKIATLREPYLVMQLDATAYPGNSGSPVYRAERGTVVGIINQVFVKGKKEDVLSDPSAITYAIPAHYLAALLQGR